AIHMRSVQRAADSISKASAGRERPPQADFFLQRLALFAKEAGRIGARQQRHGRLVGGVAMGARPALSPGLTGAAAPTSIDAAVYGFVANIYFHEIDTLLKRFVLSKANLVRW